MRWNGAFSEARIKNYLYSTPKWGWEKNTRILSSQIAFAQPQCQRVCSGRHSPGETCVRNSATLTNGGFRRSSHYPLLKLDSRAGTQSQVLCFHWLFIFLINAVRIKIWTGGFKLDLTYSHRKHLLSLQAFFFFFYSNGLLHIFIHIHTCSVDVAVGTVLFIHGVLETPLLLHTHMQVQCVIIFGVR